MASDGFRYQGAAAVEGTRMGGVTSEQIAFRMTLKPGCAVEYERRHDAIWPELEAALRDAGVFDYSIFLDEDGVSLFAVLRVTPYNRREALPGLPVMQRWWACMADLMETGPDDRPAEWPLRRVFRLRDSEA